MIPTLNVSQVLKNYMDEVVREARDKGYVETLFKRRRELPDINSRNFNIRGFAERTAINSPIQGSAADILKIAMIQLDKALVAGGYQTKMLLQVHDEIVLEVSKSELAEMKKLVKQTMEEAIQLSVPLTQMKMKVQPGTRLNKKSYIEFEAFVFKLFFMFFCKQFP